MNLQQFTFPAVTFLASLTVLGQVALAGALLGLIIPRLSVVRDRIARHGLLLMLIVTAVAVLGSLFFSEIAGWVPCKYCWIQRILMYPQLVLLPIAIWKRDVGVARYVLALSLIGAAYAAYHYYIQMYDIVASPANPATPCDASGESCVKTPFTEFGYITIPMMALTAFALNIAVSTIMLRRKT